MIFRVLQQHHHQTTPPLPPTTSSRTTSEYPAHKTHTRVTNATEVEQNTAQQWEQQQSSSPSRQGGRAFAWNPQAAPYQPLAGEEDDDQLLLLDEQQLQQWQQQWQAAAWYTGWEQQQQGYEPAITHPHHFGVPSFSLPPPSTTITHDMSAWLNQVNFWTALMHEAAAAASTAGDSNGAYHTMPPYQPEYQQEDLLHFQQHQQHPLHHHQEDQPDITRCLPAWLASAVQTSLPLQLEYVVQYENQADDGGDDDDDSSSRVDRFLASSWRQGLAESRWEGSWLGSSEPHERYDGVDYYSEPSDEHHRCHQQQQQQQGMRRRGYVRPRVATEADKKNADDDDAEGMWLDLGDVDRMRWSGLMNAIRDDDDDDEADPGAERCRPFATLAEWERNWPIPDGDAIWGMYWG
ncbi:hypothetical protein DIS24_g5603 [Lasiodiplodia hormozganensis]|uniref:Uncharacterized protein n=1 Tax=Lasiodiplodia hormozganensis TaxID=869390 RepID=A0AA40CWB3_9PEZI|nr:hypothetical protein DIS24_g5603 [Lasiodiplodia hormozganensis]